MKMMKAMKTVFQQVIRCGLFLLVIVGSLSAQTEQVTANNPQEQALVDSLLNSFSLEEMVRFREFYQNEINLMEKEEKLLREKGIHDGEKMYAINPDGQFMDKVLFRLAEFYFQKQQEDLFKKMDKYEQEFARFEKGERAETPKEPQPDYSQVIEKYELIIAKFPQSPLMDDILYHLAYTYDQNFQPEKALPYYQQVAERFPDSRYVPEALIRMGEYYFDPQRRDLNLAIQYYSRVVKYNDTPRYDEALYKLGWCYFLQEKYDPAIESLTLLVEDIEKARHYDPLGEYSNPSLKEEALEYVGICFHSAGGLSRALAFIDSMGLPEYGAAILTKIGDIYRENEEKYNLAIQTYDALLTRYPFDFKAPEIQEKVVLCARRLEDDDEVYLAQQKLYENYKPESEWQNHVIAKLGDPIAARKILAQANQKVEFALRDNINLSIRQGEDKHDSTFYHRAVADAGKYLTTFPYDTSAYTIHWNMAVLQDTKLQQKKAAFQAYLDICNNYEQDRFKKYAAQNAIVIAREIKDTTSPKDSTGLANFADLQLSAAEADSNAAQPLPAKALTSADSLLVTAYDNFIEHFPHDPETAVALGNVGTIYYGNQQFDHALRYFNTLLRRFPESPQTSQAQLTAMESYFGKRDYTSTEIVAKRIQEKSDLPPELKEKARRRLAESIFLHAEVLAKQNEHLKAANEFKRILTEVPEAVFADKALFQAGVQFDLAKEYNRAIEMYSQLISRFPQSMHFLDAINNLALDYAELKEFQLAANTYEQLSSSQSDSSKAQDALFNASYFYVQAKDWRDAIRVNRLYVDRYPNARDAEDMFYNMADYYLKLDDYDHANEIYGEFAAKYPDSPRSVETYFKRGDYFRGKTRMVEAFHEFDLALAKNKELKAKNLPANDFYAAEALFAKSEEQYNEFVAIKFTQLNLKSEQEQKKQLLQQLEQQYTEVASLGTIRIYESMYKIGRLYENFAATWSGQELPSLGETERIVFISQLNQTSARLFDRAFVSYKSNYQFLRKLVDNYHPANVDSSKGTTTRVTAEDSTMRIASRWVNLTGEKISEMLYRIADLNTNSIARLLQAPIPPGLDEVSVLEYRNQVLAKAVYPIVDEIAQAHVRNLTEADSLQLSNEWVALSQQHLADVMRILPEQYQKLCLDAYDTYVRRYNDYANTMSNGTTAEKENALDLAGKLLNVIELSNNYANMMLASYKSALNQLTQLASGQVIAQSLLSDCIGTTILLAGNYNKSAGDAQKMKDNFMLLNQRDPQMYYEDALYTFGDSETSLHNNALTLCETTYNFKQTFAIDSIKFAKLATMLVELDPQKYSQQFNLPVESATVLPDSTWLMTTAVADSAWMLPDNATTTWRRAQVSFDSTYTAVLQASASAVKPDSTIADSTAAVQANHNPTEFFVRKDIVIEDIPLSAKLTLKADDNVWVYLNGQRVFQETADSTGWENTYATDLTSFLYAGKNMLAVEIKDSDGSGHGFQPKLELSLISRLALYDAEQKLAQRGADQEKDFDARIFNRYYVPEM